MNVESFVVLSIRGVEIDAVIKTLLADLNAGFLSLRSAEVRSPGSESYRFPWSLDYGFPHIEDLPLNLPGEVECSAGFTRLVTEETTLSSRVDEVLSKIQEFRANNKQQERSSDDLFLKFWGPCKIAFVQEGSVRESWFLRQKLSRDQIEPICQLACAFGSLPEDELVLDFSVRSRVWSRFKSYDYNLETPIPKKDLRGEIRSAEIIVDVIITFLVKFPNARVQWGIEREGQPDLLGFIPEQLQQRIGKSGSFHSLSDRPS